MITTISECGKVKYGIKEFIVDSIDDLAAISDCAAGSMALVLDSG